MAKKSSIKIIGVKASTIAMFEGTLGAILGLGIAIIYSLNTTIKLAEKTDSVFAGLSFGVAAGVVSIIVLPLVYFGLGWIVGYVHGWMFNVVAGTSGGIEIDTAD